jgi:hypothetical protein
LNLTLYYRQIEDSKDPEITTKIKTSMELNPANSLIRFQFLEVLMRLGLKKVGKQNPLGSVLNNWLGNVLILKPGIVVIFLLTF